MSYKVPTSAPSGNNSRQTTQTDQITQVIWFDKDYINSYEGAIKIATIMVSIIAFIIAQFGGGNGKIHFFSFVSMSAFWISLFLFGLYCFHIVENTHTFPWILLEFFFSIVWCAFYIVSSILVLIVGNVMIVAAVFGFCGAFLLGYEARYNYMRHANGEIAQGSRSVQDAQRVV